MTRSIRSMLAAVALLTVSAVPALATHSLRKRFKGPSSQPGRALRG